jgi:hypothetical protein
MYSPPYDAFELKYYIYIFVQLFGYTTRVFVRVYTYIYVHCVHKVPSGFWKIVVRKQIELATGGLRQITVKLWKFMKICFLNHSL